MERTYRVDNVLLHNWDRIELMRRKDDGHYDLAICEPPQSLSGRHLKEYVSLVSRISERQLIWGVSPAYLPEGGSFFCWNKVRTDDGSPVFETAWYSSGCKTRIYRKLGGGASPLHTRPVGLYLHILGKYARPGDNIYADNDCLSVAEACMEAGFWLDVCIPDKRIYEQTVFALEGLS